MCIEYKIVLILEIFVLNLVWEVIKFEFFIKESFKEIIFGKCRFWVCEKNFWCWRKYIIIYDLRLLIFLEFNGELYFYDFGV